MMNGLYKIVLILLFSMSIASTIDEQYKQALNEYSEESYGKAINIFNDIIKSGYESHQLYYNLGNSYFRLDSIGLSIWSYEKSLELNSLNDNSIYNLKLANLKVKDRIEIPELPYYIEAYFFIIEKITIEQWINIILLIISIILFINIPKKFYHSKKILYNTQKSLFVIMLCVIGLFIHSYKLSLSEYAIVKINKAQVFSEPNKHSTILFILNEGLKVKIIQPLPKNWYEIELFNGEHGWINADEILNI